MATKDIETLSSELLKVEAQKRGFDAALNDNNLSEDEKQELQSALYESEKIIKSLKKQIEQHSVKKQKSNWKNEQPLVDQAILDNHIGYLINEDKFIYCRDFGSSQSNVQFKTVNSSRIIRALNKMTNSNIQGKDYQEMIDYFQQTGNSYFDVTSSFNRAKWRESDMYNKMSVIQDKWLKPIDDGEPYDQDLDILIECVAGGKAENVEHLEKWVAFKYTHPGKNANTPNLDLGGSPGGNGKGRFIEMLKTIFTPSCVVQAHREELDKFNANWEMAVVLYYDEPEEKELAAGKLKQATGSEDMRIERKGVDAAMADRNYNFVFMSNNQNGVVILSGGSDGGEDRRYSVINTDLVLLDIYRDSGLTKEQAQLRLDNLAQKLVKDPLHVGRWLANKIKKYSPESMVVLPALHGQDYNSRFEDQKDSITECFDAVLPVFQSQEFMPLSVLVEIVRAYTGQIKLVERTVVTKWTSYLKRNKIEFDSKAKERFKTLWAGTELKNQQGRVFNIKDKTVREFEWNTVSRVKPNYTAIGLPLAKDNLII